MVQTLTFILIAAFGVCSAGAQSPVGYWTGGVSIDGELWPIAVTLERSDEALAAYTDLPHMGMIRSPAPVDFSSEKAVVQLPFGLGPVALDPGGDPFQAERKISDSLTLDYRFDRAADRPPYTVEDVSLSSDGLTLAGTLFRPRDTQGRLPAAVKLHGSAVGDRSAWELGRWVQPLLENNVAVLLYDRRGEGESQPPAEPDHMFESLARDAVAAAEFLADRPDIDPERIGFLGGSQAAWIAAQAAVQSERPAFLILTGAPAVSPGQQERQAVEERMRAADAKPEDIQHALAYLDLYFHTAVAGTDFKPLREVTKRAADQSWGKFVDQPQSSGDLDWWRRHAAFDMRARLRTIDIPVLAIWGERDLLVPPARNLMLYRQDLRANERDNVRTLVCPGAGHSLEMQGMTRDAEGRWVWPQLAPNAREAVADFARTIAGA